MTKEEIIEFTKFSGLGMLLEIGGMYKCLEHFAKMIAEKEREECAKMCDYVYDNIVTDEHIKAMAFKIRTREQE